MFKYEPSTLVEGDQFIERFCDNCEHDREFREIGQNSCEILANSFLYSVHDEGYPEEWTFKDLKPVCTAFKKAVVVPYRCKKTIDMFDN